MKKWEHDELADDLATHLFGLSDRMVWTDMQLGPSGSDRPDVYTMAKSYSKPRPMAYEIKISVHDFRSDITSGKWQKYLDHAAGVTFCTPRGLINRDDVPKGCGLMIRGDTGWTTIKGATLQPVKLKETALLKLLIDGVDRVKRPSIRIKAESRYIAAMKIRHEIGAEFAKYLYKHDYAANQLASINARLDAAKSEFTTIGAKAEEMKKKIKEEAIAQLDSEAQYTGHDILLLKRGLGLPENCSTYELRNQITKMRKNLCEDERTKEIMQLLESTKQNICSHIERLSV